MAGLQLSGLASGFDWKTVVDQLIAISRTPQTRLRTDKTANLGKLNAFTNLRTRVTALQDAAKALSTDGVFSARSAKLSETNSTWKASATNSSVLGEFAFDVTQVATKTTRTGSGDRAANLNATNDVSGVLVSDLRIGVAVKEGVFTINGAQIEVEDTDSLQEVFAKIAAATDNAVTGTYNASTDRVSLAGTGPITLGGGADTSNFLYALKLYNNDAATVTSSAGLGTLRLSESLADAGLATAITAVDGAGAGSFEINGTTIAYDLQDDTLQEIIKRVNESDAGVTLTYDPANDGFRLTNDATGDVGLDVSETSGGLLAALGLTTSATLERGDNAIFSVNDGGTIISASNVLDAAAHGLSGITVTVDSVDEQTVTVTSDAEGIKKGIRTFIDKFNDVQKFVDDTTKVTVGADGKVTAALFANNREMNDMARALRSTVFDQVAGLSGTITRLEHLGIDFNAASSQLAIRDTAKLDAGLASNLAEVSSLFSQPTTGLSAKLTDYIGKLTRNAGILDAQESSLEKQNLGLDNQIAALERHLEAERTRLEGNFIRMEEAQSLMNSQLTALQRTLNL